MSPFNQKLIQQKLIQKNEPKGGIHSKREKFTGLPLLARRILPRSFSRLAKLSRSTGQVKEMESANSLKKQILVWGLSLFGLTQAFPSVQAMPVAPAAHYPNVVDQPVKSLPNQPIPYLDLNRYLGTWYEIARLPMFFQRNCDHNVSATYTLLPNGHIGVDNRCMKANGTEMRSVGDAKALDDSHARLAVSFMPKGLRWLPFTRAPYWVIAVSEDYRIALVGHPDRKYLWLLSREKQLPESELKYYVNQAAAMGYPVQKLIMTRQSTDVAK